MTISDRILLALFLAGFAAIAFIAGSIAMHYELAIIRPVEQGLETAEALVEKLTDTEEEETTVKGKTVDQIIMSGKTPATWDKEKALNGYTLITLRSSNSAYLLDMQGKVVHRWHMPFRKVWPQPPHIRLPIKDDKIYLEKAHVFPNGDLLIIYTGQGDTPYGYGLAKIDKDSRLLWKYSAYVNHDFYIDPKNGNIYTLVHNFIRYPVRGLERLIYPLMDDHIVTLSPDGKELSRISVLEAFRDSPYKDMLFRKPTTVFSWDPLHTNSVAKLEPETAAAFPMFAPGQLLISLRNMDALAVIDPAKRSVIWAYNGLWKAQHSAHFMPNGRFLVFDNFGYYVKRKKLSRVVEFNPATLGVEWTYSPIGDEAIYTFIYGRVQPLPNGNTLVSVPLARRALEVTREGKVVWDYRLPAVYRKKVKPPLKNKGRDDESVEIDETKPNLTSAIVSALRYTAEDLPFLGAPKAH